MSNNLWSSLIHHNQNKYKISNILLLPQSSVTLALGMKKKHSPEKGRDASMVVEARRSWQEWEVKSSIGRG